jgi:hypothetical protein
MIITIEDKKVNTPVRLADVVAAAVTPQSFVCMSPSKQSKIDAIIFYQSPPCLLIGYGVGARQIWRFLHSIEGLGWSFGQQVIALLVDLLPSWYEGKRLVVKNKHIHWINTFQWNDKPRGVRLIGSPDIVNERQLNERVNHDSILYTSVTRRMIIEADELLHKQKTPDARTITRGR